MARASGGRAPGPIPFVGLLLLLALLGLGEGASGAKARGMSRQGEFVIPHWISGGRSRRAVGTSQKDPSPPHGEVVVILEGKDLILELEKNHRLLSPEYTETHYTKDGQMVTVSPNHTDHCYYHGHVRGYEGSWVALSTCSGIGGLIVLNHNDSYYLKPPARPESEPHLIYRTEHLPLKTGTCGHNDQPHSSLVDMARFFQPDTLRRKRRLACIEVQSPARGDERHP